MSDEDAPKDPKKEKPPKDPRPVDERDSKDQVTGGPAGRSPTSGARGRKTPGAKPGKRKGTPHLKRK